MYVLFRVTAALLCVTFTAAAFAAEVPALTRRVTDLSATLNPEQSQYLEGILAEHEAATGNQIAVLILPSTGGEPIEQYALRVFESWKLGQSGKDNGVLFVIAKDDRKMRIEVGYGLEGDIPDVMAARIIREVVAPRFKESNYYQGIADGLTHLMIAATGQAPDWEEGESAGERQYASDGTQIATPEETRVILVWPSLVILTFILIFTGQAVSNRVGQFLTSLGFACFFGVFIAAGMMIFFLNGEWPQMRWWWQYLPAAGLGILFSWLGVGRALTGSGGFASSGGYSSSSRSSSSSSSGRSSSGGFSGGGGRSGGGGASGGW